MEKVVKGDIVAIPFPFSDLSQSKKRPALVLADIEGEDIILFQITSKPIRDKYAIASHKEDFIKGDLPVLSNIRPNRIFTADKNIVIKYLASLSPSLMEKVVDRIIEIIA